MDKLTLPVLIIDNVKGGGGGSAAVPHHPIVIINNMSGASKVVRWDWTLWRLGQLGGSGADRADGQWVEQLRKGRQLWAMGGGQGECRVRPRRQAGVEGGVLGSDAVAAVAEGRERRRGG